MKKVIITALLIAILCMFCGCNQMVFDTNYTFDYAIVEFPGEDVRTIQISKWTDYEDGEQLQILAKDGTIYLVSSVNCVLVRDK